MAKTSTLNYDFLDRTDVTFAVIGVGSNACSVVRHLLESSTFYAVGKNNYFDFRVISACFSSDNFLLNLVMIGEHTSKSCETSTTDMDKITKKLEQFIKINHPTFLILISGLDENTSSGLTVLLAKIARDFGIVTAVLATKGVAQNEIVKSAIKEILQIADTCFVISNDRVLNSGRRKLSESPESLSNLHENLGLIICDLMRSLLSTKSIIQIDSTVLQLILRKGGLSTIGTGTASGVKRIIRAGEAALKEFDFDGKSVNRIRLVLVVITASESITAMEIQRISDILNRDIFEKSETYLSVLIDKAMRNELRVTLFATNAH